MTSTAHHPNPSPPKSAARTVWATLLVMLCALALYAPTVRYDYVTLDDPMYVEEHAMVRNGFSLHGLKLAFTTAPENYWAPLLWMSFMADMEISRGAPAVPHLTNALLFALNAGLIFILLRRWTGRTGVALLAALLWTSHPTRVESVAWITARKDVLSGVFFFLGLWFYTVGWSRRLNADPSAATAASSRRAPNWGVILAWLCMLLGGMAKQVVIVMPGAMVLLDVWPLNRTTWDRLWKDAWRLIAEKWAFWMLGVAYAALPIIFHVETKAVIKVPVWHRALMILVHYLFYISKVILPIRLMPLQADLPSWWELLVGAGLILGWMTWGAWKIRRRHPLVLWGWLWFAVLLFPLSGVVWAGAERIATRWLYIPQIGLMLLGVAFVADWLRGRNWPRWPAAASGIALALVWAGMSLQLSQHWRSRDKFGIWAYNCNPGHPVAAMLGGDGYLSQKNWAAAAKAYEQGSSLWEIHSFLRLCLIWNCCGNFELTDNAWLRFERGLGQTIFEAVAEQRDLEKVFAWRLRGQCMQARGDLPGAIIAFKNAVDLEANPSSFTVAEYLRASHDADRYDETAQDIAARMSTDVGEDRSTWQSLFPAYAQIWRDGARGYAYGYFLDYAARHPEDAVAFNNMAWLLATAKPMAIRHAREEEWPARAREWAEHAVASEEGAQAATAWDTLGAARANAGDFTGAVQAATQAARLARQGGGLALARQIETRIASYRQKQPWHE